MTIELKKQTTEVTGRIYYYVSLNGIMMSNTWTTDLNEAFKSYEEAVNGAKAFPKTVTETIHEYCHEAE